MRRTLIAHLKKDQTFEALLAALRALKAPEGSGTLQVTNDYRTQPYLEHKVVEWVDGPPNSNVVAVVSGADPDGEHWRRFTLTRKSATHYELDVFPTPFPNAVDPLSPGIPPGSSQRVA
jgi:hypothetical protein